MKIDQLPVEILMKIFDFLPIYRAVSLVNRLFYSIVCKVDHLNICLRIDRSFYERILCSANTQLLSASCREISKVVVEGSAIKSFPIENMMWISAVLERFSATIKSLKLSYVTMNESSFMEILSLTPNVESLELSNVRFINEDPPSEKRCRIDLNIKKLKSLSILRCNNEEFVEFFNGLPIGILSELRISKLHGDILAVVVNRQVNIKKLCLNEPDQLTINHVSKELKLKTLILTAGAVVSEPIMNALSDLLELETLELNITETPVGSFTKIRKLKNLQDLTLHCDGDESASKLKILTESNNTLIRKLTLKWSTNMPVNLVALLAASAPNLKYFDVLHCKSFNRMELDAIMQHFNFVETLKISISCNLSVVKARDYYNPRLRELAVFGLGLDPIFITWLTKLAATYPNMTKLKIISPFTKTSFKIKPILDGFHKLESLSLRVTPRLMADDLDYLIDHRGNLKFVSLADLTTVESSDRIIKKFSTSFGVVKIDCDNVLNAAVDRYTMKCELEMLPC